MRWVSMTAGCQCRCVEHVWWHIRLLYTLLCVLVVVYGCSVTWLLTTRALDSDCQGCGPSADETGVVEPIVDRRVRRSSPRRRHQPAFYRDSSGSGEGNTVDSDEWVWMSTYSKIPTDALVEFCAATKDYCPKGFPGDPGIPGAKGDTGDPGSKGDIGPVGPVGAPGQQGVAGPIGPPGLRGLVGPRGIPGEPGLNGTRGRRGRKGAAGVNGTKGDKGDSVSIEDFDWTAIFRNYSRIERALESTEWMTIVTESEETTLATTPEPTIAPRTDNCRLRYIHKPDFQRYIGTYWGAWFRDARPPASVPASWSDKIWVSLHYRGSTLLEYADYHDFRHDDSSIVHDLNETYTGTGHVVYAGAFYYHRDGSREVVRYDLSQKTITGRITLADVEYEADNYLYANELNYVDLAADENGLWAIYTPASYDDGGGNGDGGWLRVAKLSTDEMSVEKAWTIPVQPRSFGNGFIACGILYLVRDTRAKTTSVDYAYDMFSETPVNDVRLSFTNPFEMNNMVAYNPNEKTIYSWDKGNQLVYRLLM